MEAQRVQGVLHAHGFVYFQMAHQFQNLEEIASGLREGMLTAAAMKAYVSFVRCAAYPDVKQFENERAEIEHSWPAYASDLTLSQVPGFLYSPSSLKPVWPSTEDTTWVNEGAAWKAR